jgi:hypothetical protein
MRGWRNSPPGPADARRRPPATELLHCGNDLEGALSLILKAQAIPLGDAMLHCSKKDWPAGPAAHK